MVADPFEDSFKGEYVVADPCIVPFDRDKEVQIRAVTDLFNDLDGRKTFVRNDDPVPNIVIQNE